VRARRDRAYTLYSVDPAGLRSAAVALDALSDPSTLVAEAWPGGNSGCCA